MTTQRLIINNIGQNDHHKAENHHPWSSKQPSIDKLIRVWRHRIVMKGSKMTQMSYKTIQIKCKHICVCEYVNIKSCKMPTNTQKHQNKATNDLQIPLKSL